MADQRILLVDDSRLQRQTTESLLREAGYDNIVVAVSSDEALEVLGLDDLTGDGGGVDLVLMDIIMPELDGIAALEMIRGAGHLRDIPVIIITGRGDRASLERAFEAGARDYLTKPVDRVDLVARVRSALRLKEEMDRRKQREKELFEANRRLAEANRKLEQLSNLDGLTGVANRRFFDALIGEEWLRGARAGLPLAVIMIDIDLFKAFNDLYGHLEGDECLKVVAKTLNQTLRRPGDAFARYGGEEFVAVLAETGLAGARRVAEAMKDAVAGLDLPHEASTVANRVTISLGVASGVPSHDRDPADLVAAADEALYQAKQNGRDRIETAEF